MRLVANIHRPFTSLSCERKKRRKKERRKQKAQGNSSVGLHLLNQG